MTDDHDALAREQEREVDDLQRASDQLGEHLDAVQKEQESVESEVGTPTPDPAIEDVEQRPGPGREGPTKPADAGCIQALQSLFCGLEIRISSNQEWDEGDPGHVKMSLSTLKASELP